MSKLIHRVLRPGAIVKTSRCGMDSGVCTNFPPTFGSPNFIPMRLSYLISWPGNCVSSGEYPGKNCTYDCKHACTPKNNVFFFFHLNSLLRVSLFVLLTITLGIEGNTDRFMFRYIYDMRSRCRTAFAWQTDITNQTTV